MWAAIFATALAATLLVVVGRRGLGLLVGLLALFSLVGLAFIGFYNPAWAALSLINPISLVLGVVVGPREEHQLELLLSKPVPAADFLAARTWPVLAMTTLVGVTLAVACAAATLPYLGARGSVSAAGALGSGLAMTAIVLVQLTALSIVFVRLVESMNAVLLALLVALVPMLPSAVFLYRPDVFAGRPELAAVTVLANLVWYDATMAWLGPLLLLVALVCALVGVRAGGRLLQRAGRG